MERTGREDNLPNIIPPSQSTSRGRSSSTLNRLEQTARQVQAFVETQRHENVPQTNVGVAAKLASNFNDARKTVGVDKKKKKAKGRPTDVVQLKITCLSTPHTTQVNRLDIGRLKRMGLGYPDDEITPSKRVPSRLPTTMTPQEFGEFLKISFPPLRNAGYDLAYATQNTLFPFQEEINTPALIKQYLIKASKQDNVNITPCSIQVNEGVHTCALSYIRAAGQEHEYIHTCTCTQSGEWNNNTCYQENAGIICTLSRE
ncbi:unnamed protein product [Mytilus edulis]|uniref:Uncharacterized protein n=1 Tax=Mytilus edulis TaxID=6550 RepID=A0A8S3U7Z8_MYTED|nr:unnamed protein product [Mytilus edulis]